LWFHVFNILQRYEGTKVIIDFGKLKCSSVIQQSSDLDFIKMVYQAFPALMIDNGAG
jgi:hypothetical protein